MKTNPRMRRGFTLVELLVVISIIATLAGVGVPVIIAQKRKGDRSEATANIKQVGMAMFSFDQDYGTYPGDLTATGQKVIDNNPSDASNAASNITLSYTTSNGLFCQLIRAGFIDSEKSFYAKSNFTKKPDNNLSGTNALSAGECGFSYIVNNTVAQPLSSSGNSGQPLLIAAAYKASGSGGSVDSTGKFDPDVYDKKAVVFRIDNSATAETVRTSDKYVIVSSGTGVVKTLLDNGTDTVWGTDINPKLIPPLSK